MGLPDDKHSSRFTIASKKWGLKSNKCKLIGKKKSAGGDLPEKGKNQDIIPSPTPSTTFLAAAHIHREIKEVLDSAKRRDENLHSCKYAVWACFWQETGHRPRPQHLHPTPASVGGPVSPKDTFSSVCLPGPPAAEFIVLNQMPSHASCRWTLRSMGGIGGKCA